MTKLYEGDNLPAEQSADDHVAFSRQRTSGSLGVYPVSQVTSATAPYVVLDSDTSVRLPFGMIRRSPQSDNKSNMVTSLMKNMWL